MMATMAGRAATLPVWSPTRILLPLLPRQTSWQLPDTRILQRAPIFARKDMALL